MCLIDGTWTDPKGFYAEMTIAESSKPTLELILKVLMCDASMPETYLEMTIVES